jgi:hypothetical protein
MDPGHIGEGVERKGLFSGIMGNFGEVFVLIYLFAFPWAVIRRVNHPPPP